MVMLGNFKTQEMCIKAVEKDPWHLYYVPDHFKTQKIYDDAVWRDPFSLWFFPEWFVTQEQVKLWHDYDYYYYDKLIGWYEGYQKRKA